MKRDLKADLEKMSEIQKRVITAVLLERKRQDSKWGEQNHPPHYWTGILGEEYGELCEAINETVFDNWSDKGGFENMRREAIHVAAVAIGFLECLERNKDLWFSSPTQSGRGGEALKGAILFGNPNHGGEVSDGR